MAKLKKNYTYAVGRRKSSVARVRLFKGTGDSLVNDILIGKYFPGETAKVVWQKPFQLTENLSKYYVTVRVTGGGKNGQIDAVSMGVARALSEANPKFRGALKKAGLLTRDARERERRKVGTGGRARRQKQSPKR
jgi:small subunit ribosomal protein S9